MIENSAGTARQAKTTKTLLHLDSSVSPANESVSRQLTALFADTWRTVHGSTGYRYRDLATDPVPPIAAAYADLGRRMEGHGVIPVSAVAALTENAAEEREWELTLPLITELRTADTLLVGVPMYNLSVPAALKVWIDRVSFPGAFTDPGTGNSLLRGTSAVVVMAQGGGYGPGAPREGFDFQTPYLRAYFGNLGVAEEDLHIVCAEMTRAGDVPELARFREAAASSLTAAQAAVRALAAGPAPDAAVGAVM